MSDTESENRPPSPKEEMVCPLSPKEEDSAGLSVFVHDQYTEAAPEKAEKENTDDIGGELDYEEELLFPSQDNSDDKKDESKSKKVKKDVEEGEDEGEISGEEEDLEEGELVERTSCETSQSSSRQICRFFTRGQCYYGTACRFLHLTNTGKGQYNMFARYSDGYYNTSINMMMCDRTGPHAGIDYMGSIHTPAPPMQMEQSPVETAWERGLREAKELVKKANKRKEEEPDFDKKKNYLTINFNEKNTDFDKENDYLRSHLSLKRERNPEAQSYKKSSRDCEREYDDTQRSRDHLRGATRYENFEIHYTHTRGDDMMQRMNFRERRERSREERGRTSGERERYASKERNRDRNKVKDDRALFHVQMRTRAFEYVDPWRRSKTPKARGGRSRSGSPYSSVSSSYSERSSRSASGSYSRSSSRSSCASSRSPSMHKRKSPGPEAGFSKTSSNRFPVLRKKPGTARSPSFSSRSRSVSTAPSASRSRSYSRSISVESVSSDSSCVSNSSCESLRKKSGNSPPSLRKKSEEKLPLEKLDEYRESLARGEIYMSESYPEEAPEDPAPGLCNYMQFLPDNAPGNEKAKSQHKQPIKLTLLSKPSTSKTCFPKKELDRSKLMPDLKNDTSKPDNSGYTPSGKRPLSPASSPLNIKPDPVLPKKSASSRRDELLKQLKAVEDAIARKRAKFC